MKQKILYGVIILNYNTSEDCVKAVNSIHEHAVADDHAICLVDGGSSREGEPDNIGKIAENDEKVIPLILEENKGYACGNNAGIRRLLQDYDFEYTVIMNPDVEIKEDGTIEKVIDAIRESGEDVAGGQPLVNTIGNTLPVNRQINIRKVFKYKDIIISNFWLLRRLKKRAFNELTYVNERPYDKRIRYEVPSGAFFVIDTNTFRECGFFDEDTFLYAEEFFLGYRVKERGKCFILEPSVIVDHDQGSSSGSKGTGMTSGALKRTQDSMRIYMTKCLKKGKGAFWFYKLICRLDRMTAPFERLILKLLGKK